MAKICKECGSSFVQRKGVRAFCGLQCWYAWKRKQRPREGKCIVCGGLFSCVGKAFTKTCSWKCRGLSYRKRKTLTCLVCGNPFEWYPHRPGRKTCSKKCTIAVSIKNVEVKCLECGLKFKRGLAFVKRSKRIFCSKDCYKKHNRGQRSPLWRRGGHVTDRGSDWPSQSAAARDRDGHICQVCGSPEKKSWKLHVDHIIPFRMVNSNDLVNLLSACGKCHTKKTHFENYFLKGDLLEFRRLLNLAGWPTDKVEAAFEWWGKMPQMPFVLSDDKSLCGKGLHRLEPGVRACRPCRAAWMRRDRARKRESLLA